MKVYNLIALQDFVTYESHGKIVGVAGEPLEKPVMYSTARRLTRAGLVKRKRAKRIKEGENGRS